MSVVGHPKPRDFNFAAAPEMILRKSDDINFD
jgi:hypothetical protein